MMKHPMRDGVVSEWDQMGKLPAKLLAKLPAKLPAKLLA